MLSEDAKISLSFAVQMWTQRHGDTSFLAETGPAGLLDDGIIDRIRRIDPRVSDSILANREEAERYLGGLLGLC